MTPELLDHAQRIVQVVLWFLVGLGLPFTLLALVELYGKRGDDE